MKDTAKRPKHIVVIMDGNGRWAQKRLRPRVFGHRAGLKAAKRLIECAIKARIEALTVFAFSSENWSRPDDEVNQLMKLFSNGLKDEAPKLNENGVQIEFIGDLTRFNTPLQQQMQEVAELTKHNDRLKLRVAVNYGGQWDIAHATSHLIQEALTEQRQPTLEQISDTLTRKLMLAELPEPDLFIRTGGERRISNFLLWQLAYTELYFTDTLWPDFAEEDFNLALADYAQRQRRFGRTGEQVQGATEC